MLVGLALMLMLSVLVALVAVEPLAVSVEMAVTVGAFDPVRLVE